MMTPAPAWTGAAHGLLAAAGWLGTVWVPPMAAPSPGKTAPSDASSMLTATWVTALATAGLFAGAVVTAIYAVRTFRAQDREIKLMGQQRDEQRALTRQQIELLQLQAQALRKPRTVFALLRYPWASLQSLLAVLRRVRRPQLRSELPIATSPSVGVERDARTITIEPGARVEVTSSEPSTSKLRIRTPAATAPSIQASEVLAWQEHMLTGRPRSGKQQQQLTVRVQNTGTMPIYHARIHWYLGAKYAGTNATGVLPPGNQYMDMREALATDRDQYSAIVEFTDSRGNRWVRDPATGDLAPAPQGIPRKTS